MKRKQTKFPPHMWSQSIPVLYLMISKHIYVRTQILHFTSCVYNNLIPQIHKFTFANTSRYHTTPQKKTWQNHPKKKKENSFLTQIIINGRESKERHTCVYNKNNNL